MALTANDILSVDDIKRELVSVPEWGGDVWVRGMTGEERDKFEASVLQIRSSGQTVNMRNLRAKIASMTICDEDGVLLFDGKADGLAKKSAAALQRVFVVAQRLSRIGDSAIHEATDGLKKNPTGGSVSD